MNQPNNAPVVILVEPQLGENIGTAARAMANFGLDELRLVAPRDIWPNEAAEKASANAVHVVRNAVVFDRFEEAIADMQHLLATTARPRDMVKPTLSPESATLLINQMAAKGEKTGILFGREKSGLSNDHVSFADHIVIAPVNPECASLNLAQAVLLMGYEWRKSQDQNSLGRKTHFDGPAREGTYLKSTRQATKRELTGLFTHMQTELEKTGFLRTVEKTPQMMRNMRNMIIRMQPTDQDVRTMRGMISSLVKSPPKKND